MASAGKTPEFAIAVTIRATFFRCAKCVIRSRLWDPRHWPDVAGPPSLARAMVDAGKLEDTR